MASSPQNLDPLILYATETGTAEDVADQIARQCRRISVRCRLADMALYSPASPFKARSQVAR